MILSQSIWGVANREGTREGSRCIATAAALEAHTRRRNSSQSSIVNRQWRRARHGCWLRGKSWDAQLGVSGGPVGWRS